MRVTDREKRTYFRSATRVFHQNGVWFFATREGDHGPFTSQEVAAREATRFTADCASWERVGSDGTVLTPEIVTPRDVRSAAPRFRSWGRLAFKPGYSAN